MHKTNFLVDSMILFKDEIIINKLLILIDCMKITKFRTLSSIAV